MVIVTEKHTLNAANKDEGGKRTEEVQGNNPITIAIMLLSSSIQSVNHPPSLSPLSPHPNEICRNALRFISIQFSSSTTRANSLVRSLLLKKEKIGRPLRHFSFNAWTQQTSKLRAEMPNAQEHASMNMIIRWSAVNYFIPLANVAH